MKPYSPIPRFMRGADHDSLIRRLLLPDLDPDVHRIDLITTTFLRLSIIDSGHTPVEHIAEGDTCVHVLWQADEADAIIAIGGERLGIAPGDSAWIPAGDSWQLSPNQLVIAFVLRSNSLAVQIDPTHGEDRFTGHNRESMIPSAPGVTMSRWKLTEPLVIAESSEDIILVGLFNDIAIQYESGVSMLPQGEASVIRPATGQITLVPNGLSYVLVIS